MPAGSTASIFRTASSRPVKTKVEYAIRRAAVRSASACASPPAESAAARRAASTQYFHPSLATRVSQTCCVRPSPARAREPELWSHMPTVARANRRSTRRGGIGRARFFASSSRNAVMPASVVSATIMTNVTMRRIPAQGPPLSGGRLRAPPVFDALRRGRWSRSRSGRMRPREARSSAASPVRTIRRSAGSSIELVIRTRRPRASPRPMATSRLSPFGSQDRLNAISRPRGLGRTPKTLSFDPGSTIGMSGSPGRHV